MLVAYLQRRKGEEAHVRGGVWRSALGKLRAYQR
jgi:hypothetical protein